MSCRDDYDVLSGGEVMELRVSNLDSRQLYMCVCRCMVGDSVTTWQRSACAAGGEGGALQSPRPLLFLGAR